MEGGNQRACQFVSSPQTIKEVILKTSEDTDLLGSRTGPDQDLGRNALNISFKPSMARRGLSPAILFSLQLFENWP